MCRTREGNGDRRFWFCVKRKTKKRIEKHCREPTAFFFIMNLVKCSKKSSFLLHFFLTIGNSITKYDWDHPISLLNLVKIKTRSIKHVHFPCRAMGLQMPCCNRK